MTYPFIPFFLTLLFGCLDLFFFNQKRYGEDKSHPVSRSFLYRNLGGHVLFFVHMKSSFVFD